MSAVQPITLSFICSSCLVSFFPWILSLIRISKKIDTNERALSFLRSHHHVVTTIKSSIVSIFFVDFHLTKKRRVKEALGVNVTNQSALACTQVLTFVELHMKNWHICLKNHEYRCLINSNCFSFSNSSRHAPLAENTPYCCTNICAEMLLHISRSQFGTFL